MRHLPFLLTVSTLSIAAASVVSVTKIESARANFDTVYLSTTAGTTIIVANQPIFSDSAINCYASIRLNDLSQAYLYQNAMLTVHVKVIP